MAAAPRWLRDGLVLLHRLYAAEHAAEISRDLMQDLLLIPGEVLLDVYDDYYELDDA